MYYDTVKCRRNRVAKKPVKTKVANFRKTMSNQIGGGYTGGTDRFASDYDRQVIYLSNCLSVCM